MVAGLARHRTLVALILAMPIRLGAILAVLREKTTRMYARLLIASAGESTQALATGEDEGASRLSYQMLVLDESGLS